MPVMTQILLRKDGAAADNTFLPVKDVPFPSWRTNVDGLATEGQAKIDMMWQEGKNETKVNVKVALPIMEIIPAGTVDASGRTASPKVAGVDSASITFFLSNRGTQTTRAELMRAVAHLCSGANSATDGHNNPTSAGAVGSYKASSSPMIYGIVNKLFPGA